jgi:transcription-repair coupling factor (superfamily II helicase)
LPAPAEGLLALARLRVAALVRGIDEIAMSSVRPGGTRRPVVRLSPVRLPASAEVRLRRSAPGAAYREDLAQLLVPIPEGERAADAVRQLVEDLIPAGSPGDAATTDGTGATGATGATRASL